MAMGTSTVIPVLEFGVWYVGCGEGELVDVPDGAAEIYLRLNKDTHDRSYF